MYTEYSTFEKFSYAHYSGLVQQTAFPIIFWSTT